MAKNRVGWACFSIAMATTAIVSIQPPGAAMAQATQPAEPRREATRIEEIIVTATKREESLKDVPVSVTAFTGDELVRQSKDSLKDYIRAVPGVSFRQQSSGLNQVTIRGISGGFARAKSPVSFYIDDMPVVSDPVATPDLKTFDVERIEVLRGPQGTLFGESAIGGVIRVISKKPDPTKFEGAVQAGYSTYRGGDGGYSADAAVNVPVVADKIAVRANLSRRDEGGYIDNLGLGRENQNTLDFWSGRVSGLVKVNERLEATATAFITRSEYGAYPAANRSFQQNRLVDESRQDDIDQYNLTVRYSFDAAELVSSTNWMQRDTFRLFDASGSSATFTNLLRIVGGLSPTAPGLSAFWQTLGVKDEQFAQEVRLTSTGSGDFRWLIGGYYFSTDNSVGVDFLSQPAVNFNLLRLRREETYEQTAAFGEAEYDFAPQWTLIAGVRYTMEDRETKFDQSDSWPATLRPLLPATGTRTITTDYSITTPRVSLRWQPTDEATVYGSISRGFRGPGGNIQFSNNPGENNNTFDAETLWAYEIGAKSSFLDGKLYVALAAFFNDWQNRQEVRNPLDPLPQQFVANAGEAETKGIEAEVVVNPTDFLTLGGSLTAMKTEITESPNPALVGTEIINMPKTRFTVFAETRFPIMADLTFVARGEVNHQNSEKFSQTVRNPGYALYSASIGIEAENWDVKLYGRNIGDKFVEYFSNIVGDPRLIGVTASYRF